MNEKIVVWILNSPLVRSPTIVKIGRVLYRLFRKKYVEIEGRKMFCHGNDGLALSIFKTYEPSQTQIVKNYVKEGDSVIDVGAHVGYYTLLLSQLVGKTGKVYAFEPDPKNFELLKKNIEVNGFENVELIQKAVSNKTEIIKLYLGDEDRATNRIYDAQLNDTKKSIEIKTISLDEYIKDKKIDFVKIDVEGSELGVLKGMKSIFQENKQIKIITEFFPFLIEKSGNKPKEILKELENLNFEMFEILYKESNEKIDVNNYLKKNDVIGKKCTNLLCIRK
jgi:FkbM family methyltransferase